MVQQAVGRVRTAPTPQAMARPSRRRANRPWRPLAGGAGPQHLPATRPPARHSGVSASSWAMVVRPRTPLPAFNLASPAPLPPLPPPPSARPVVRRLEPTRHHLLEGELSSAHFWGAGPGMAPRQGLVIDAVDTDSAPRPQACSLISTLKAAADRAPGPDLKLIAPSDSTVMPAPPSRGRHAAHPTLASAGHGRVAVTCLATRAALRGATGNRLPWQRRRRCALVRLTSACAARAATSCSLGLCLRVAQPASGG